MKIKWNVIFLCTLIWKVVFGGVSQYLLFNFQRLDVFKIWILGIVVLSVLGLILGALTDRIFTIKHVFGGLFFALTIGNGFEFLVWLFSMESVADSGWREGLAFIGARQIVELGVFFAFYHGSKAVSRTFINSKLKKAKI